MIRAYVRLVQSRPRDLRRARRITLGAAMAFWILFAVAIAAIVPHWAIGAVARDRQARALGTRAELREYLSDRLAALRFLATVPSVASRSPLMGKALGLFGEAYPEFSRVYVAARQPGSNSNRPLFLAARIRGGGYVVGLLRPGWTDSRFRGAYHFRQGTDGARTVLVTREGARTPTKAKPPAWNALLAAATDPSVVMTWGDGKRYVTSVARVGDLPDPHPAVLVVCAVPYATVVAKATGIQRFLIVTGSVVGLVTGVVGCVVLSGATRWLSRANRELERRVAERTTELAMAERSFRGIFENVPLGLYQCDPSGAFLRVNPMMAQMLGFANSENLIQGLGALQAVGEREPRAAFMACLRENGEAQMALTLTRGECGRPVWLAESARAVRDDTGEILFIEGAMHDVTAQRELESQLRRIGETDPLTGLLNRRGLQEAVASAPTPVSFVALDVDRFKDYNDAYGHPAGDQALRTVAEAIRLTVRGNDAVARAGGEEFVVVLPRTDESGARRVADALREAVEACGGLEVRLTISGGVATASTRDEVNEALAAADRALYLAKEAGRNRIVVNPAKLA